jgi:sugar lactone lactonase YvrE
MTNVLSGRRAVGILLALGIAMPGFCAEVLIADAKSQPESLTVAPGGTLIVGSASSPFIYKVKRGSSSAETFYDAKGEGPGTFFLGVLADPSSKTVWACQLTPVAGSGTPAKRHTALLGLDLKTGKQKLRWDLPGESTLCNDFAIGPDKALYITDTPNAKIYRLPRGASSAELFTEHPSLKGIDGITFVGKTLYVNNVATDHVYRIPVDASGKAGEPVDIALDQPVKGPDGMRAAGGKLFVAENHGGKISVLTVNGDKATVTVLKEGLKTPTGIEPAGKTLWFTERGTGKVFSIPTPK